MTTNQKTRIVKILGMVMGASNGIALIAFCFLCFLRVIDDPTFAADVCLTIVFCMLFSLIVFAVSKKIKD